MKKTRHNTRRRNPADDYVGVLEEVVSGGGEYSLSEIREGSGLPRHAARVLQVAYEAFGDGAFTRRQLVDEAERRLERASGGRLSSAASSVEANKALRALLARDFVRKRPEKEGPDRYVVTRGGMEMAVGDRLVHAEHSAEDAIEREIARYTSAPARGPRRTSRPGRPTYIHPHAAARKTHPCRLCAVKHRLSAHRSHAVAAGPVGEEPPVANPKKKKRGKRATEKRKKAKRRPAPARRPRRSSSRRRASRPRGATAKLSKAARRFIVKKIRLLVREGRGVKQAAAMAFAFARKRGFSLPPRKNTASLLTVVLPNPAELKRLVKLSRLVTKPKPKPFLPSEIGFNPRDKKGKKRNPDAEIRALERAARTGDARALVKLERAYERTGSVSRATLERYQRIARAAVAHARTQGIATGARMARSGGFDRPSRPRRSRAPGHNPKKGKSRRPSNVMRAFLATKPDGFRCHWKDLPESVKRDPLSRKAALRAANFNKGKLAHVLVKKVPVRKGTSHAITIVGDLERTDYRVRFKDSVRFGRWTHAAGDHGRGKKKTRPPLLAIDARDDEEVLVRQRGTRRGFSSRRGLVG